MVTRRQAREWAVMMLCECDLNPPANLDCAISTFWIQQEDVEKEQVAAKEFGVRVAFGSRGARNAQSLSEMKAFAEVRIRGVIGERANIDTELSPFLEHWSMYRLGTVERNVLRLGAWEILHAPEIPTPIVINEAVDLAKYFSDSQSGKFVNGVLDRFAKSLATRPFTPSEP